MKASVPEVAKVLGIPCPEPNCNALITEYCDKEKGTVHMSRVAQVIANDAVRALDTGTLNLNFTFEADLHPDD